MAQARAGHSHCTCLSTALHDMSSDVDQNDLPGQNAAHLVGEDADGQLQACRGLHRLHGVQAAQVVRPLVVLQRHPGRRGTIR